MFKSMPVPCLQVEQNASDLKKNEDLSEIARRWHIKIEISWIDWENTEGFFLGR